MKPLICLRLACLALAMSVPAMSMAQSLPGQPAAEKALLTPAGFDQPVNPAALAEQRGGAHLVANDMQLSGTTAGNSATSVVTGANAITAGAFSNMSGLPVVIQNSGANVLIQNALILNLQIN